MYLVIPSEIAHTAAYYNNHAAVVHTSDAVAFRESVQVAEPADRERLAKYHSRMAEHALDAKLRQSRHLARFGGSTDIDLFALDRSSPMGPKSMPDDVWLLIALATDFRYTPLSHRAEAHVELVTNGIHLDRFNLSRRGTHVVTTKREDEGGVFLLNLDLIDCDDEGVSKRLVAARGLRLGHEERVWSGEIKAGA